MKAKRHARTSTLAKQRAFASRDELLSEVHRVARAELQREWPHLTDKTFDRWTRDYGPTEEEPKAHRLLRAIRDAFDDAYEYLGLPAHRTGKIRRDRAPKRRESNLSLDALEGPDRQLRDILDALNMFPTANALNHAERSVGFRAYDVPELRDRRTLIEELLRNDVAQFTPRQLALVSLAIGFMPGVKWQNESVASVIDLETKTVRSELARLKTEGEDRQAQIEKVVSVGERGRPKKRN